MCRHCFSNIGRVSSNIPEREDDNADNYEMGTGIKNEFDILSLRTESLSHNLPDVLPIDVKLQQLSTLAESPVNGTMIIDNRS